MNQYAAAQIALAATLTQARKRTRRWKLLASLVVVGAVAHQFSPSVRLPQPVKRGVVAVQQVVQAAPAAKPVTVKSEPRPIKQVKPSAEDRRREAAAAARARRRYEAEVRRTQQPPVPPTPQRVEQPERVAPRQTQRLPHEPQRGVSLGTVLMTAAQAARVAEQIERGRFDPSRELQRAARRAERAERRRHRAERRRERWW